MSNLVRTSKQTWKLVAFFISLVVGMGLVVASSMLLIPQGSEAAAAVILLGTLIGIISFVLSCVFIACPNCKNKWLWDSMRLQHSSDWLSHFWRLESCPKCGVSSFE